MDSSMSEALKGHSVAVLNAGKDPRIQYREQAVQEGIASVLSVPLYLWGQVIGVMRVYSAEPREFTAEDIEFVGAVANLGAVAMENAQRFEELKKNYVEARQNLLELYATWREERSPEANGGRVALSEE